MSKGQPKGTSWTVLKNQIPDIFSSYSGLGISIVYPDKNVSYSGIFVIPDKKVSYSGMDLKTGFQRSFKNLKWKIFLIFRTKTSLIPEKNQLPHVLFIKKSIVEIPD